jgi:hypothetical protein
MVVVAVEAYGVVHGESRVPPAQEGSGELEGPGRGLQDHRVRWSQTFHVLPKLPAGPRKLHLLPLTIQQADRRELLVPVDPMYPLDHSLLLFLIAMGERRG